MQDPPCFVGFVCCRVHRSWRKLSATQHGTWFAGGVKQSLVALLETRAPRSAWPPANPLCRACIPVAECITTCSRVAFGSQDLQKPLPLRIVRHASKQQPRCDPGRAIQSMAVPPAERCTAGTHRYTRHGKHRLRECSEGRSLAQLADASGMRAAGKVRQANCWPAAKVNTQG